MTRKDYSKNYLNITEYPTLTLATTGRFVGCPVLHIKVGDGIKLSNKQLADYISTEFVGINKVLFSSKEDVTTYSDEVWSFIKYCKSFNVIYSRSTWWGIVTSGKRWIPRLLYELDDILIDILTPSTGRETPPEFISWCYEDENIKDKVQFRIIIGADAKDISFARYEVPKLGTLHCPITLQPLYWNKEEIKENYEIADTVQNTKNFEEGLTKPTGWKSYIQFVETFIDTVRYPHIRILPDLVKILEMKKYAM